MTQNQSEALDKVKPDGLDDYVERISLAVHYNGSYDHEDVHSILKEYRLALLNSIEAGLPRRKKFKNGGLNITKLDDERVAVHNLALEEIKQLIKQERDKL